ncbi:unnamed protein product [Musa acuminata var. zebrina]
MAGGGGGGDSRELDQTATWAVAAVCAVIVLISILLEKGLQHFGEWLNEKHKKALYEALEKVKDELMILGFISLLLTFGQSYIAKICIPETLSNTMLPCPIKTDTGTAEAGGGHRRKLLTNALIYGNIQHRILAAGSIVSCPLGKGPLISMNGLHQLHIFIFFLAVFHVASGALTMTLGRAKMRRWKEWETETSSIEYDSVCKADYLALRHGFINVILHVFLLWMSSPVLWASAVMVLLLNVNGWEELFWASILPLVIILAIGMKLQAIIARMAIEIQERHVVVQGIPLVQLSDRHFWFKNPQFALFLIHFALFQNAFQITYFFWIWYEFGLKSCFHDNFDFIIARVSVGVGVQFLCSYITLPLYALVSQMGSHMKRSIFDEQTSKALKKWHQVVKKKHEKGTSHASSVHETSPRASSPASPLRPLQRYRTIGHTRELSNSSTGNALDHYNSDTEIEMLSLSKNNNQESRPTERHLCIGEHRNNVDQFSFEKLSAQTGGQPQS